MSRQRRKACLNRSASADESEVMGGSGSGCLIFQGPRPARGRSRRWPIKRSGSAPGKCRHPIGSIAPRIAACDSSGYRVQSKPAFRISRGAAILPGQPIRPQERPMSRSTGFRLANIVHFPAVALLWASAAPTDARGEADNGIVRVKSAVPMAEAITRIKADIAAKASSSFPRSTSPSSPPMPASSFAPRPCWCSAIRRSAPSSSHRIRTPGSIGRCACC